MWKRQKFVTSHHKFTIRMLTWAPKPEPAKEASADKK
jgi:hypothetical protein